MAMLPKARISKTSAQDESWGMKDESRRMKEVLAVGFLLHFKGGIERKSLDQWRGPTIYKEEDFLKVTYHWNKFNTRSQILFFLKDIASVKLEYVILKK